MEFSQLMSSRDGKHKQELTCPLVVVITPVLRNNFDCDLYGFGPVNRHRNCRRKAPALSSTGLFFAGP